MPPCHLCLSHNFGVLSCACTPLSIPSQSPILCFLQDSLLPKVQGFLLQITTHLDPDSQPRYPDTPALQEGRTLPSGRHRTGLGGSHRVGATELTAGCRRDLHPSQQPAPDSQRNLSFGLETAHFTPKSLAGKASTARFLLIPTCCLFLGFSGRRVPGGEGQGRPLPVPQPQPGFTVK